MGEKIDLQGVSSDRVLDFVEFGKHTEEEILDYLGRLKSPPDLKPRQAAENYLLYFQNKKVSDEMVKVTKEMNGATKTIRCLTYVMTVLTAISTFVIFISTFCLRK